MTSPDGEEITARRRAVPQERACPTCGGPVVSKAQAAAEWADYAAWVDRGTGMSLTTEQFGGFEMPAERLDPVALRRALAERNGEPDDDV